jgi:hypothetical protein
MLIDTIYSPQFTFYYQKRKFKSILPALVQLEKICFDITFIYYFKNLFTDIS